MFLAFRVESWDSAASACEKLGGTLPVLDYDTDALIFQNHSKPMYFVNIGAKVSVCKKAW